MPHILVVCTANICRSPVAEALLRRRLQERNMDDWSVSSAGTWAAQGRGAAENSVQVMSQEGIDIGDHRSRLVNREILAEADLILCMEKGHVEALRTEFPEAAPRIHLFSAMAGENFSVSDPYGGAPEEYQRMAATIDDLIDTGIQEIIDRAWANHRRRMLEDTGDEGPY